MSGSKRENSHDVPGSVRTCEAVARRWAGIRDVEGDGASKTFKAVQESFAGLSPDVLAVVPIRDLPAQS